MAKVEGRALLTATITIALTEAEAEALNALVIYGDDNFLQVFYEHLGRNYLLPHERGLRSLFHSIRDGECGIRAILERAKAARKVFYAGEAQPEGGQREPNVDLSWPGHLDVEPDTRTRNRILA